MSKSLILDDLSLICVCINQVFHIFTNEVVEKFPSSFISNIFTIDSLNDQFSNQIILGWQHLYTELNHYAIFTIDFNSLRHSDYPMVIYS